MLRQPMKAEAPFRVFLCSTYTDLVDERALVLDAIRRLQLQHDAMEFFGARPDLPIETCLAEVRRSNLIVVIVGCRYGSLVPGRDVSYSEAEYEEARRLDRPALIYLRDEAGEDPTQPGDIDPPSLHRLENWKTILNSRHTVARFRDGQQLSVQVVADISRIIVDATVTAADRATKSTSALGEATRQFRTVVTLVIRSLEKLSATDLTALFEQSDRGKWPSERDLSPSNLAATVQQAQSFDADLYEDLRRLDTELLYQARVQLNQMNHLANDRWQPNYGAIRNLEAELNSSLTAALVHARTLLTRLNAYA